MLGNLGKKDRRGRQARVGHHGKNLRISRTGGVSLRHAVRVGKIGLSANSRHGLRLSSALGRGTQVATQNGRFILRGRYGKGPVKFNLSKSGLSASLASEFGRLNLTRPGRSSAKLFGVQVRGRNAATINAVALLAAGLIAVIQLAAIALMLAFKGLVWLFSALFEAIRELVWRMRMARSNRVFMARYVELQGYTDGLDADLVSDDASRLRLLAHWLLLHGTDDPHRLSAQLQEVGAGLRSERQRTALQALAEPIELGAETTANMDLERGRVWCLLAARLLFKNKAPEAILELFLALDDLCLALGEKTEDQEELLALIAETGEVRLSLEDTEWAAAAGEAAVGPTPGRRLAAFLRTWNQAQQASPMSHRAGAKTGHDHGPDRQSARA